MPANPTVNGGLKYVGNILGDAPGGCITCVTLTADASPIGIGDPVKLEGTGNVAGLPSVIRCAEGDRIFGVVEGVLPDTSGLISEGLKYRAGSTARALAVRPADNLSIYEIAENNVAGNLANTNIGQFCNLAITSCDTISGLSKVTLNSANASTNVGQVRIIGFAQRSDNVITNTGGKWLVLIGTSQIADGVGAV